MNFREQRRDPLQNLDAADAADRFVGVRKMMADVVLAHGPEQCIGDRMADHVRVRMPVESAIVRDLDAAENEFSPGRETMRIVTISAADRAHSFKSTTPLDAM